MTEGPTPGSPRRVLIVSADIGEGHNAAGRALAGAAGALWPGVRCAWVDVFDRMGAGPLFRGVYAGSVRRAPWLYEFFYGSVWRHRWFARAAKRVIGAWSGRALASVIDREQPDLILCTHPMGSSGLEWLRQRRGMVVPTGAWITDVAPHPSWVHAGVDLNLVMHEVAVAPARAAVPGARVEVSGLPVDPAFRPGDRPAARRALGLPEITDGPLTVVSCGSLGFGAAGDMVAELRRGDPGGQVVVVTGRNRAQRAELTARYRGDDRVRVLGWVADMPALITAADLLVTNAGGVTALEALACGRALVLHDPIAGHGRANAALLERAGLARVCAGPGALAAVLAGFRADPGGLAELAATAGRQCGTRRLADGLRALAAVVPGDPGHPLPASDALFLHAETPQAGQYVGTVLVMADGAALTRQRVARLLAAVPGVCGWLEHAGLTRRARWHPAGQGAGSPVDPLSLVDEVRAAGPDGPDGPDGQDGADGLAAAVDAFFTGDWVPVRGCGAARIVTGLAGGQGAVLIKLHHALGDGISVLRALLADVDGAAGRSWTGRPERLLGAARLRAGAGRIAGGLVRLARAGRAPVTPLTRPTPGADRRHVLLRLPGRQVRQAARAMDVTTAELLNALFADAVARTMDAPRGARLRLMVPWSVRGTGSARAAGNLTGAVAVDLPVGPMSLARRAALVAAAMRERVAGGVPEAAHAVVRWLGVLPPGLHVAAARAVYRGLWFSAIGTVLPGPRRAVTWNGTPLLAAYPILAHAPGTALAWGAMTWGEVITVSITGRAGGALDVRALAAALVAAVGELDARRVAVG